MKEKKMMDLEKMKKDYEKAMSYNQTNIGLKSSNLGAISRNIFSYNQTNIGLK